MATLKDKLKKNKKRSEAEDAEQYVNDSKDPADEAQLNEWRKELATLESSEKFTDDKRRRDNVMGVGSPFKAKEGYDPGTDRTTLAEAMRKKIKMAEETPGFARNTARESGSEKELPKLTPPPAPPPDQPEDDKDVSPVATTKPAPPKNDKEVSKSFASTARDAKDNLRGEQRKMFLDRLNEIRSQFDKDKERIGWLQAATLVTQAIARFAAAQEGVSGLEFHAPDWEKKLDRISDQYRTDLGRLEKEEDRFERGEDRKAERELRDERERTRQRERGEDQGRQDIRDASARKHQEDMADRRALLQAQVKALTNAGKVDKEAIKNYKESDSRLAKQEKDLRKVSAGLEKDLDTNDDWALMRSQLVGLGFSDEEITVLDKQALDADKFGFNDRNIDVIRNAIDKKVRETQQRRMSAAKAITALRTGGAATPAPASTSEAAPVPAPPKLEKGEVAKWSPKDGKYVIFDEQSKKPLRFAD